MNEEAVYIWIRRAESDFKIGKDELATEDPATDATCFHMQQCCEKYLKAFLVFHGEEIPRTHDLALLIDRCSGIDPDFGLLSDWGVDRLTDYAVLVRYDAPIFPTVEEAREAMELAERVRNFVRKKLKERGLELP
ncbi:MAG: HEPN domain-containing protein [Thermosphaera sp.]